MILPVSESAVHTSNRHSTVFLSRAWLVKDTGRSIYKFVKLIVFLFDCRLVVEGEVVTVYHTLENSRVFHEKDLDSVEFGLEVRLVAYQARVSLCSMLCVVACFSRLPS